MQETTEYSDSRKDMARTTENCMPTIIIDGNVYEGHISYLPEDLSVIQLYKIVDGRSRPLELLTVHDGDMSARDSLGHLAALVHEAERRKLEPESDREEHAPTDCGCDAFLPDVDEPHQTERLASAPRPGAQPTRITRTAVAEIAGILKIEREALEGCLSLNVDGTYYNVEWRYCPSENQSLVFYQYDRHPQRGWSRLAVDGHPSERSTLKRLASRMLEASVIYDTPPLLERRLERVNVVAAGVFAST